MTERIAGVGHPIAVIIRPVGTDLDRSGVDQEEIIGLAITGIPRQIRVAVDLIGVGNVWTVVDILTDVVPVIVAQAIEAAPGQARPDVSGSGWRIAAVPKTPTFPATGGERREVTQGRRGTDGTSAIGPPTSMRVMVTSRRPSR